MAILYTIYINNPNTTNENTIANWPPQIEASDWYAQLHSKTFYLNTKEQFNTTKKGIRILMFSDSTEFESWVNTNRLTDTDLIAAINEWKSAHGISYTEEFYELPAYTPSITGLLG